MREERRQWQDEVHAAAEVYVKRRYVDFATAWFLCACVEGAKRRDLIALFSTVRRWGRGPSAVMRIRDINHAPSNWMAPYACRTLPWLADEIAARSPDCRSWLDEVLAAQTCRKGPKPHRRMRELLPVDRVPDADLGVCMGVHEAVAQCTMNHWTIEGFRLLYLGWAVARAIEWESIRTERRWRDVTQDFERSLAPVALGMMPKDAPVVGYGSVAEGAVDWGVKL